LATSSPRGSIAARQPSAQTNSDGSRDDSDRPQTTKVRPCPGHTRQGSGIRILAGSNQQIQRRLLWRQRPGIVSAAHAGHLPGLGDFVFIEDSPVFNLYLS